MELSFTEKGKTVRRKFEERDQKFEFGCVNSGMPIRYPVGDTE